MKPQITIKIAVTNEKIFSSYNTAKEGKLRLRDVALALYELERVREWLLGMEFEPELEYVEGDDEEDED